MSADGTLFWSYSIARNPQRRRAIILITFYATKNNNNGNTTDNYTYHGTDHQALKIWVLQCFHDENLLIRQSIKEYTPVEKNNFQKKAFGRYFIYA